MSDFFLIFFFTDFDECASGENDCSRWAMCTNTWASYSCICLDGFIDNNPERPGRNCQGRALVGKLTQVASSVFPTTTTTPSITSTTPSSPLRSATNSSLSGALSVLCRVAAITVTLARAFLASAKIPEGALYLGMPECGVNAGNASHVHMTVAWNECGTRLVHVSLSDLNTWPAMVIFLEVPIMCTYMTSMLISADFGSMGYNTINDVLTGLGSFQVAVQLMNGTAPLPHNYSLSPEQAVVMEVSLNSTSEQMKVVISKCWATPAQNPADPYSYAFLENSCPLNAYTKVLTNGNSTTSRVSVQIFSFVNLNVIYLHCQVQICVQVGSNTCVPVSSLEEKLNTIHIVGLACLGVGLSLCFIVGFVCLFYCQRNRIGHYNFNAKPKEENFTYLVFNT
uniref:ZP domain-containing protein n=1 Tax=Poecilia reticulata TaxID=8081 RepID=A0A3P9NY89_POERE